MHKMEKLSILASIFNGRDEVNRRDLEDALAKYGLELFDKDIVVQLGFLLDNGYVVHTHTINPNVARGFTVIRHGGDKVSTG